MARILVTGGAGFLGSYLCRLLIDDGHDVVCLDNFSTGSRSNVSSLLDHRRFRVLERDVCVPIEEQVEEIFNLACPASPRHYQREPIATTRASVIGAGATGGMAID